MLCKRALALLNWVVFPRFVICARGCLSVDYACVSVIAYYAYCRMRNFTRDLKQMRIGKSDGCGLRRDVLASEPASVRACLLFALVFYHINYDNAKNEESRIEEE